MEINNNIKKNTKYIFVTGGVVSGLGVDSVITNKPDVAKSVRNELSNDAENTEN